jgi:uncharacterized protein YggL (DUF469 family)
LAQSDPLRQADGLRVGWDRHGHHSNQVLKRMVDDTRNRTRRLRKKLRVGEFRVMGFPVSISLIDSLSIEGSNAFWDRFILEAMERRGLLYGGLGEGYATSEREVSATDVDRHHVQTWLLSQPEVIGCEIGHLTDACSARGPWFTVPPVRQCTPALKRRHWAKFRRTTL